MAQVTIYYDVTDKTLIELQTMNSIYGAIFPVSDGKCVKWTYEKENGNEAKKN